MSSNSVFMLALGGDAERLHPAVRRYAEGVPEPGVVGVGAGEFEIAGSKFRRRNLLLRPFVGSRLLVTAHERGVPFTVVNANWGPGSAPWLSTERTFRFSSGPQAFVDVLRLGDRPHTLLNVLGDAKRIELELCCSVSDVGTLCLSSRRAWFRLGPFRLRLLGPLAVHVEVEDGFDEAMQRQTINATVRSPLAGTILEYRGSFTYAYANRQNSR